MFLISYSNVRKSLVCSLFLALCASVSAETITIGTGQTQTITTTSGLTGYDSVLLNGGTLAFALTGGEATLPTAALASIQCNASGTLNTTSSNIRVTAALSGAGTLSKNGDKHLILAGDSSAFTGKLIIAQEWFGLDSSIDLSNASVQMNNGTKAFLCSAGTYKIGNLFTDGTAVVTEFRPRTAGQNVTLEVGSTITDSSIFNGNLTDLSGNSAKLSLNKVGTGTWIVTQGCGYTGTTTVSAGTLQFGNGGSTGENISGSSAVTIASGATLAYNRGIELSLANTYSGAGTFKQMGTNTIHLTGNITAFIGAFVLNGGIVDYAPTSTTTNAVGLSAVSGAGTLKISAGTLSAANWSAFTGSINLAGGRLSGDSALDQTITSNISVTADSKIGTVTGHLINLNGKLTGSATLTHTGNNGQGHLFLNGDNSGFSGTFNNESGWLGFVGTDSGSAAAAWKIGSGVTYFLQAKSSDTNKTFKFGKLEASSTSAVLRSRSGSAAPVVIEVGAAIAAGETSTYAGQIYNNSTAANEVVSVIKTGAGTWRLTGTNLSYTGATTIQSGAIQLDAALSGSNVTVKNGASIFGTGTISKNLFVDDGGSIRVYIDEWLASDALNPLTISGDLSLADGAFIQFLSDSDDFTEFVGKEITFLKTDDYSVAALASFLDFSAAGGADLWNLALNGNVFSLSINSSAIPEPAAWVLMILGAGMLFGMRRRKR